MRAKGFPDKFLQWVREILVSSSSSVLLNGVPGKPFICKRGVRQGDPLSPLLFVEGADLLQSLVNQAYDGGSLSAPIPVRGKYPIIQYADDTIIVLHAIRSELEKFREILQNYAAFSGLKVNYHKSFIIPINLQRRNVLIWQTSLVVNWALCLLPTWGFPWVLLNLLSGTFPL
jgi:hypothetical protein